MKSFFITFIGIELHFFPFDT